MSSSLPKPSPSTPASKLPSLPLATLAKSATTKTAPNAPSQVPASSSTKPKVSSALAASSATPARKSVENKALNPSPGKETSFKKTPVGAIGLGEGAKLIKGGQRVEEPSKPATVPAPSSSQMDPARCETVAKYKQFRLQMQKNKEEEEARKREEEARRREEEAALASSEALEMGIMAAAIADMEYDGWDLRDETPPEGFWDLPGDDPELARDMKMLDDKFKLIQDVRRTSKRSSSRGVTEKRDGLESGTIGD